MTGIMFWMRKRRLTAKELADMVGVSAATISTWSKKVSPRISTRDMIRVSDALEVSIDEACANYDESQLEDGDQAPRKGKAPTNCIGVYLRRKNLNYTPLASRMKVSSKQSAYQACQAKRAGKEFISRLSEYEGISPAEFQQTYAFREEEWV